MGKQKLRGKDLRKIGFVADRQKSLAINLMAKHYKNLKKNRKNSPARKRSGKSGKLR